MFFIVTLQLMMLYFGLLIIKQCGSKTSFTLACENYFVMQSIFDSAIYVQFMGRFCP